MSSAFVCQEAAVKLAKSILCASVLSMIFISIILIPYSSSAQSSTLNVSKSGTGGGTITSSPRGINCAVDCVTGSAQYGYNLKVTLKAKPDLYSTFLGWGGDCPAKGLKPTCTIKMDSDKKVMAIFGLPDISVSPIVYDFGSAGIKQSSSPVPFTIHNSGTGNLEMDSIQITGADKKMFKIGGSKRKAIQPGDNYQFTMTFKPSTTGLKNAVLIITSNDPDTSELEIPVTGFACTVNPKVTICKGTIDQCLNVMCGWKIDAKAVSDPTFCDASVIRLPDGRYRLYGNYTYVLNPNEKPIDSWISDDGIIFQKEPGSRLTGPGIIWPNVVMLPDGRFRMYFTDQSVIVGAGGSMSIKSAISDDGLNFVVEEGDRLTYSGEGYESDGLGRAKILALKDGTYRMYYTAGKDNVARVLSAVSSDGLNWVREEGVRLDPQILCPANPYIEPSDPFIDSNGIIHQYIWTTTCKNQSWKGAIAGMFDFTSVDGLTFSIGRSPIITGYYFKDAYSGKPDNPGARMDNAPVVMTPDGLRVYLYTYCPQPQCADWPETGYYSALNPSIR
jgi:predicted GH43/DUF377 family glycosyl hydrolase